MKIKDLKYAVLEGFPTIKITTDSGIYGLGQIEFFKPYLESIFMFLKELIVGQDPTNVQKVMSRIKRLGGFKPWGSTISAIEIALWDITGKANNLPIYKLLGGKLRDKVRVYCTVHENQKDYFTPEEFASIAKERMGLKEGYTIFKFALGANLLSSDFIYSEIPEVIQGPHTFKPIRGHLTEIGLKHMVKCVRAVKEVVNEKIGIAFDCGPRMSLSGAIKLAKELEPFNILWLEDMLTGDYTPYNAIDSYRLLSSSTSIPILTGEQIYLREGFKNLIETHAVDIIGPDPEDVGGIAEIKWIAEMADLYDILIAPHGVGNGPVGLAAIVQATATFPNNFIAFEMPVKYFYNAPLSDGMYRYNYREYSKPLYNGLEDLIVENGFINVPNKPGLGIVLNVENVKDYLGKENSFYND